MPKPTVLVVAVPNVNCSDKLYYSSDAPRDVAAHAVVPCVNRSGKLYYEAHTASVTVSAVVPNVNRSDKLYYRIDQAVVPNVNRSGKFYHARETMELVVSLNWCPAQAYQHNGAPPVPNVSLSGKRYP